MGITKKEFINGKWFYWVTTNGNNTKMLRFNDENSDAKALAAAEKIINLEPDPEEEDEKDILIRELREQIEELEA